MSKKRRFGDRKDAVLLRHVDSMHFIMPIIFPNRSDNEAFISERIDLTNVIKYVQEKNEVLEGKCTVFQFIVAAMLKTLVLRPKMNRFIANRNLYQRNEVSASFVIKKQFNDESEEGLAVIRGSAESTFESVHNEIQRQVTSTRSGKQDASSDVMDTFNRMPRFIAKSIVRFFCVLDRHGKIPQSMIETDPYYASVLLTNLGSIGLKGGYHHLANWGTNSVFVTVGDIKKRPFETENGTEMRDSVDIGMTVDERIADGYYYSGTVRLLKYLFEHPYLLDAPAGETVDYE